MVRTDNARWLAAIEDYGPFEVQHRPAITKWAADALSRPPCDKPRCCRKGSSDDVNNENGLKIDGRSVAFTLRSTHPLAQKIAVLQSRMVYNCQLFAFMLLHPVIQQLT